ncbi:helix-turn-helix domain-containing protein [Hyalangium versicolor]|uniref:helix-turn-helix domain-containing protein n=1 Tax=Hyalangium versicolor TaxID=2861190 RepID=UPI001CCF88E2
MPNPGERTKWLTDEVAEHLLLSRSKIYEMAQAGESPCSNLAGRWRFIQSEPDQWMIQQWLAKGRKHTGYDPQGTLDQERQR